MCIMVAKSARRKAGRKKIKKCLKKAKGVKIMAKTDVRKTIYFNAENNRYFENEIWKFAEGKKDNDAFSFPLHYANEQKKKIITLAQIEACIANLAHNEHFYIVLDGGGFDEKTATKVIFRKASKEVFERKYELKSNAEKVEMATKRKEKAEMKKEAQKHQEQENKKEAEVGAKRYERLCLFLQQLREKDYIGFTAEAVKREVVENLEQIVNLN